MATFSAKPWLVTHRDNPDADRRQLFAGNPDAREPRCVRPSTEICCDADENFFEIADVAMDVPAVGIQVDDRIPDDLAGSVISHVAATSSLEYLDAARRKRVIGREDMPAAAIPADAERQDRADARGAAGHRRRAAADAR